MLLFREKVSADWLPKILSNLPAVLVDHAHLERKAATTALNLEKYRDLFPRVEELNAIAIEELQMKSKENDSEQRDGSAHSSSGGGLKAMVRSLKDDAEAKEIQRALENANWNRKRAAAQLNISYKALLYKIKQHGLSPAAERDFRLRTAANM